MYILKNCPALGQYDTCKGANNSFILFCKNNKNCLLKKIYESKNIEEIKKMYEIKSCEDALY